MASNWQIQQAAQVVRNSGVIAYPTEAVWGLGCDPWNDEAVEQLLAMKARPVHKGLILVAANSERFDFLLEDLPEIWLARLGGSWPGPNSWLMPHQNRLPEWIGGQSSSVALRVSDHAQVRARCRPTQPVTPPRAVVCVLSSTFLVR
jgi:L-threonylcarbamoyladenylate synthase